MATLFRWMSRRSLPLLHGCGAIAGWLTYAASPSYRRRFRANSAQAGLSPAQARPAIASAGRMAAELPFLWLRPVDQPLGELVAWDGAERIDAAINAGRGLVLLTPHLGCFEVIGQAYAERFGHAHPMTALYRPARQPWLREVMEVSRQRPGLKTAPAQLSGVRQMIRALRQGDTVGLLPDQVPPSGMGVWAPFFGQSAYTMTLATRLIQQTGAAWLLIWGERLPGGRGYCVHVLDPLETLPAQDAANAIADSSHDASERHTLACAGVINRAMEHVIAQAPEQYLWGYHRYKQPRQEAASPAASASTGAGA